MLVLCFPDIRDLKTLSPQLGLSGFVSFQLTNHNPCRPRIPRDSWNSSLGALKPSVALTRLQVGLAAIRVARLLRRTRSKEFKQRTMDPANSNLRLA